jgi:predicted nucleic acid-binding protein
MGQVKRVSTVYLDTNILIYLTEGTPEQKTALKALFEAFEAASARYITSELAYTEALVIPYRRRDTELIAAYERLFDVFVAPQPVSREVLLLAARLRADTPSQKTPDAIHVATAMLAQADAFISSDAGIDNLPASITKYRV